MSNGFVFTADLHLQRNAWVDRPDLWGDSYFALEQIVNYCVENHAPLVLGGDVFDKQQPDSQDVRAMFEQLDRMDEAGVEVYFIQGQHERRPTPWLLCHSWPVWIHEQLLEIAAGDDWIKIYGMDWTPGHKLSESLNAIPTEADAFISHQAWTELMGHNGDGSMELIPPYVQIMLTGDYHVHIAKEMTFADGRVSQHEPLRVLSPGSICMQSITEQSEKSFFVCNVEDGNLIATSHPILGRQCAEVNLTSNDELEHLRDGGAASIYDSLIQRAEGLGLPDNMRTPIIYIKYDDSRIENAHNQITWLFPENTHLWTKQQRQHNVEAGERQREDAVVIEGGLIGGLNDMCMSIDPQVFTASTRLLQSKESDWDTILDELEADVDLNQELIENMEPDENRQISNEELLSAPGEDADISTGAQRYPRRQRRG